MDWAFLWGLATDAGCSCNINSRAEDQWREQEPEKQQGGWVNPIRPSLLRKLAPGACEGHFRAPSIGIDVQVGALPAGTTRRKLQVYRAGASGFHRVAAV
jgi:hypothetical protein